MIQIEYLPIVLTGIGIMASILYYASVLRNQNKTRQAQLFMQIQGQFNQPSMVDSRTSWYNEEFSNFNDYLELWTDPEKTRQYYLFGGFLEGLGVMVRMKYIDIDILAYHMGGTVKIAWEKHAPYIKEYREYMKSPRVWIEWEYLYNEIMRYGEIHPELGIKDSEWIGQGK